MQHFCPKCVQKEHIKASIGNGCAASRAYLCTRIQPTNDMQKRTIAALLVSATAAYAWAGLTLSECREAARRNYPAIRQYRLTEQSREYTLSNAMKGWLPQIKATASAATFTDFADLPPQSSAITGTIGNSFYGATLQVTQPLYDGGAISARRNSVRLESEVGMRQLDVSLFAVRERTDRLFFGVLAADERLAQNRLLQHDLGISLGTIESLMRHGMASQSDKDAVEVELLKVRQQEFMLKEQRRAYLRMLATFTGKPLDDSTELELPAEPEAGTGGVNRPELLLFQAQSRLNDSRRKVLDSQLRPQLGLFGMATYHNKLTNMMNNANLAAGITLKWNVGALYTRRNDLHDIGLQQQNIDVRRATFLLDTSLKSQQSDGIISGLRSQIALDDDIIALRNGIKATIEKKVNNGTETVSELLRTINAVAEARQAKALHQLQLLQEQYNRQLITGD